METFTGSITVFDFPRGWGFITRDSDGKRIYFHAKNKIRNFIPALDVRVQFELGPAYKSGMPDQAVNLRDLRVPTASKVVETTDDNDLFQAVMTATDKAVKS